MNEFFDESVPLDHEALCSAVERLKRKYDCLSSFSIGRTTQGRTIPAFILGSGRPGILYVGGVHALEYITSMLLLKFTADLCRFYTEGFSAGGRSLSALLAAKSIYIVPMLNPDGVQIHLRGESALAGLAPEVRGVAQGHTAGWQANACGVDLNHNFNAGWALVHRQEVESGITGPSPRRYGGPRPESEPETRALCGLCRRMLFSRVYAFHSQGEEIYWNYGPRTPKNVLDMARALARASGYRVAEPEGMASNGGFKDWFINVFARPGFTVEVGRGVNPLPVGDLGSIYHKIHPMLMLGLFI